MNTPVALIVFNRPDSTAQVFAAIRAAQPPQLFIISDGPRADRPEDLEKCQAVRAIVDQVDWPCDVQTNYAEKNMGCKYRVASGLDWVFSLVEEAIILEDDCLPHPSFFTYCESLLEKYRDDRRIGIISGHNNLFGYRRSSDSYYYSNIPYIWGWATWRRTWEAYDFNISLWPEVRDSGRLKDIFKHDIEVKTWTSIFDYQYDGYFNAWDYQLTFASLVNNWLNIIPSTNLISNLGFTDDATHTKNSKDPLSKQLTQEMIFPLTHPKVMIHDQVSERKVFYKSVYSPFTLRWERKIKKFWKEYQDKKNEVST
jgi:hypothetical protein